MTEHVELAPAKINLTLRVLGRRGDGYHEVESLVAFADCGDRVSIDTSSPSAADFAIRGPFAAGIDGPNLVVRAIDLVRQAHPALRLGAVRLDKQLPIAAGLGGGSADAAAVLRAIRRMNADHHGPVDWPALALRLGADVPVCLAACSAMMRGIGERLMWCPVPAFAAVLVNPQAPVPADKTRRVFQVLGARALGDNFSAHASSGDEPLPPLENLDQLIELMRRNGNDLERPAISVMPSIADVKAALLGIDGCLHTQLSGAGPTCFGVFQGRDQAVQAAAMIAAAAPQWWVRAATIGG